MFKIRFNENGLKVATVEKTISFEKLEKLFKLWKWDYLEFTD